MVAPTRVRADQHGPERLIALSDGVFSIAMTLLVLDISVPPGLSTADFDEALGDLPQKISAYALSFVIIGAFWLDHGRVLRGLRAVDRPIIAVTLLGLGFIAFLPFPTSLLSEYGNEPVSVAVYAATIAATDVTQIGLVLLRARRPWLNEHPIPPELVRSWITDTGATVAVFAVSIPLAWPLGGHAIWLWLLMIPVKFATGRRHAAVVRRVGEQDMDAP
ncbi:TMEM175 family protein [Streptodolium elevatio]